MKDEAAGEVPVAFVVRSNHSQIIEDEIKQFVSKQVYPISLACSIYPPITYHMLYKLEI